jgi:AAA domain/Bifunctional DNA primase/polymerase, N-terminal
MKADARSAKKPLGITAVRLAMYKRGYLPIPLQGKRPLLNGWQKIIANPEMIRSWEHDRPKDRGTGSLTKIMPTIDADIFDERGAEIIEALVREKFGKQGKLLRRVGLPPKAAFPFRVDESFDKMLLRFWSPGEPRPTAVKDIKHKIEILGDGQQVVVHGIHPDTGKLYEWSGGEPWSVPLNELPLLTAADATVFLADAKGALAEANWGIWEDQEQEKKRIQDDGQWPLIMELAVKLWGEPTSHSGSNYRFGSKGSKAVNVYTNQWHDFEMDRGGGIRELRTLLSNEGGAPKHTEIICSADIKIRAKHWLWEGHLLRGAVELLSGVPGLGKSQVQISYIACATAELPWPNGSPAIEPVNVIMVTAEDTLDQEVVPRLIAAGANLKRVFILKYIRTDPKTKRQFLLAEDIEQLETEMENVGDVGLISIDPITAYMGGKVDSHKATEVRSQLGPLKDFAERNDVAISAITHPAKNAGHKAIDHFIGSQAFVAAARIGHVCVEEMEQDDEGKTKMVPSGRILFANPKNNADKRMATLAYKIASVSVGQDPNTSETILAPRIILGNGGGRYNRG